VVMAEMATTM